MRIFIVGFTSSGKTTFGKELAKKTGLPFRDLDHEILNRTGKTVQEIFTEKGEIELRKIETQLLDEVCSGDDFILSTGGGSACFFDNMRLMNHCGITVYLKASASFLISRLNREKNKGRPLIHLKDKEALTAFVNKLLEKREPYYNQAQIHLDAKNPDAERIVEMIKNNPT